MIAKSILPIAKIFENTRDILKKNNINQPEVEAKIIIDYVKGGNTSFTKILSNTKIQQINTIIKKRLKGEPLSKIIKQKGFWNDIFYTNENTLDPRADTEILVEAILDDYNSMKNNNINFIDLCSGTGCIGLSILKELPNSHCTFIDISEEAMKINQLNADLLKLTTRSNFLISDLLTNPNLNMNDNDFIVSNPPYIKSSDIKKLSFETLHDPLLSLDGGMDGGNYYRSIFKQLSQTNYKGHLYLEIDPNVRDLVTNLALDNNAKILYIKRDYLKLDRIIKIIFI
ncbi:MAG: peptide chain release factor N(5)-glutamine methyltransferase [Alphaproteobacteria bacterium]|nr:peptide chain release factor N(5)-glutamine methyltransferase [Alphaproteobacteria bacterium]